jgi:RNA polymerase sigma factor (sigma-70 family)
MTENRIQSEVARLVEESSLGGPQAKALRSLADPTHADLAMQSDDLALQTLARRLREVMEAALLRLAEELATTDSEEVEIASLFERIYRSNADKVLRYVLAYVREGSDIDPVDIVAETFALLFQEMIDGRAINDQPAFLLGVARNRVRRAVELSRRHKRTVSIDMMQGDLDPSISDPFTVTDDRMAIKALFGQLSPIEQHIVSLMIDEEVSQREIANRLGLTNYALRKHLQRIREAFSVFTED